MMFRRKNIIRMVLVLGGVLVGLAFCEALLSISEQAMLQLAQRHSRNVARQCLPVLDNSDYFTVLCVGDSSTYGSGVDYRYSYPYQLAGLLANQSRRFQIRVISTGGANSSQISNRFAQFLSTGPCDLVILQAGNNDVHNFSECRFPLYLTNNAAAWLQHLKIFHAIRILVANKQALPDRITFTRAEEYGIGVRLFLDRTQLQHLFRKNLTNILRLTRQHQVSLWVQNYHTPGWQFPEVTLEQVYKELQMRLLIRENYFLLPVLSGYGQGQLASQ